MTDDERYARLQALARGKVEMLTDADREHLDWLLARDFKHVQLLRDAEEALQEGLDRFALGHEGHWCGGCEVCNQYPTPEPAIVSMGVTHAKIQCELGLPPPAKVEEPFDFDEIV